MRARNAAERLPDREMLDRAIANGVAQWLAVECGDHTPAKPATRRLLASITTALQAADVDTAHPITKQRLRARLMPWVGTARPNRL